MGRFDWEYTLLLAAEEAQRTGEYKGGIQQPATLDEFVAEAVKVWNEAADNNATELEEFKLQEKTPSGEVVRTVRFQFRDQAEAEEMASQRLAVAFDSDNHWVVVS